MEYKIMYALGWLYSKTQILWVLLAIALIAAAVFYLGALLISFAIAFPLIAILIVLILK